MDSTALSRELDRFDPSLPIDEARTPPTSWYLDPGFLEAELASTFTERWQFAARSAQLRAPGSYVSGAVGEQPYVVVRDDDGVLRAFHNVCRHHAACVASGEGAASELTCPYHGWVYRLDGRLKSAPGMGKQKCFERDAMSLPEMGVVEWGPFVFVCPGEGSDLAAELAPLKAMLDASGWEELSYTGSGTYLLDCNWKVYVDNYLDGGYHISHAHKGLAGELELGSYTTECFDTWSVQRSADAGDGERVAGGAIYAWLHPNFMINRYGPIMDTNLVIPHGHDRCEVRYDYFFRETEGAAAEAFIRESLRVTDEVQQEDIELCANVQRGMRSSSYEHGVYAKSETSMLLFHQLLTRDLRRLARS